MEIISLKQFGFEAAIELAADFLRAGKVVVYPTDTSYGLGALPTNPAAVRKMNKIKGHKSGKPIHVLIPDLMHAKKLVQWNKTADKLAKAFLPGPLSIALPIKNKKLAMLTSGTGYLGIRLPQNKFALALAKKVNAPITATSAGLTRSLGGFDAYSANDVIKQFKKRKLKPDLIIDAGRLKKRKPSTFVRIDGDVFEMLREGPVSSSQIAKVL